MSDNYDELYEYTKSINAVNTHSHHLTQDYFVDYNLFNALSMSYISWIYNPIADTKEGRAELIEKMGTNTYFIWLAKGLGELYDNGTPLCLDNWDRIDENIKAKYKNNELFHIDILKNICNYESIILDKYENPGSNNGYMELNRPTFRCDMFLFGYKLDGADENKNCAYNYFETTPQTLDEYVDLMEKIITCKNDDKCCSIKIAVAYERGLDFEVTSKEQAKKAFMNKNASAYDIKQFADYIMFKICEIAAKLNMPIQIHTGLGGLKKSNAIHLRDLIHNNPKTKFVIFHCSYPWMEDVLALTHNYKNVYCDLCWLPLLSTSASIRFLSEALEVMDVNRICWGCDTWTSEESYGALLAIRTVLSSVLSKKIQEGYYTMDYAKLIAKNILKDNAKKIYNI